MKIDRAEGAHPPDTTAARKERFQKLLGERPAQPPLARPTPAALPKPAVAAQASLPRVPLARAARAVPARPARAAPTRPASGTSTLPTARSANHVKANEGLMQVRHSHAGETARLGTVRQELAGAQRERTEERVRGLIARELSRAPGTEHPSSLDPPSGRATAPWPEAGAPPLVAPGAQAPPPTPQLGAVPKLPSTSAAEAVRELVEKVELFLRSQRPGLSLTVGGALAAEVEVEKTGPGAVALRILGRRGLPKAGDLSLLREELSARGLKLSALSVG